MEFSQEDIREFCQEATELLEAAEESLLALDKGGPFQTHYDAIFRAFHSTKGGAGMMELTRLQAHMHQLENQLVQCKALQKIPKPQIDLFLRGIDAAREIMAGREVKFDYNPSAEAPREASPSKSTPTEVVGLKTEAQVIPIEKNKKNNGDSLGTVLVIDDEKDIVELISQILIDNGFEVFGFTNPNDALSYLNNHPVDLIFTDYKMPQMTGFDLANVIGKKFPELPIVVVSGHTKGSVVVAGIYAIIEKPFNEEFIVQAAMHATKRYQMTKLLNRAVDLLIYQFSDLDDFLKSQGKDEIRKTLTHEINSIVELRKKIKALDKKAA